MKTYTPEDWYWIVGGDTSRFWSSKANAYVTTLPAGAGVTRIASEAELWDVLAQQYPAGLSNSVLPGIDQAKLNAALVEPGSVVRALGLVTFDAVNALRIKTGDPAYTMQQFLDALKAKMR